MGDVDKLSQALIALGVGMMLTVVVAVSCLAGAPTAESTVPFVGCAADGQTGPIPPPEGAARVVELWDAPLEQIAYYEGANFSGVYAPRGWHCRVLYGSAGATIVVSPANLNPSEFPPSPIRDQAVERVYMEGGTSGRFSVATYASRLFPKLAAAFVTKVKSEGIVPASNFERGPYLSERRSKGQVLQ